MAGSEALVFRVSLGPETFRDIEIADDVTLYQLAAAIVAAYDFDFDHAFGFYSKLTGNFLKSPRQYELFADMGEADAGVEGVERTPATEAFARVGSKMLFLFDYGDEWLFQVKLLKRAPRKSKLRQPRLLLSMGEAPVQYPSYDDEDDEEA